MPTAAEDLWPETFNVAPETPVGILRQQGAALGRKTDDAVFADVRPGPRTATEFTYLFELAAPRIAYRVPMFTIRHGVEPYPVTITSIDPQTARRPSFASQPSVTVADREQFLNALRDIFTSAATTHMIESLIAQSRDLADPTE